MAETSHIEWTDATWNPITGCTMVSAGCTNCYAMGLAATRLRDHPSRAGLTRETGRRHVWTGEVRLNEQWLDQPLRWRKPRRIFVCAHGDLFHESVPDEWINRVFAVMALAPQHTFQVLTKRPERMRAYMTTPDRIDAVANSVADEPGGQGQAAFQVVMRCPDPPYPAPAFPNVWLGTSVEDQPTADARIPHLLETPAAARFVSAEPLLGPVVLPGSFLGMVDHGRFGDGRLDWLIVGGESGPGARPMHPDWARSLRDQCAAAGVAFFFKQWGEWAPPSVMTYDNETQLAFSERAARNPSLIHYFEDGLNAGRIGKRAAGRLLDDRTHNAMPGVQP